MYIYGIYATLTPTVISATCTGSVTGPVIQVTGHFSARGGRNLRIKAPAFSNPDQKVHGLFHFYIVVMYDSESVRKNICYRASKI